MSWCSAFLFFVRQSDPGFGISSKPKSLVVEVPPRALRFVRLSRPALPGRRTPRAAQGWATVQRRNLAVWTVLGSLVSVGFLLPFFLFQGKLAVPLASLLKKMIHVVQDHKHKVLQFLCLLPLLRIAIYSGCGALTVVVLVLTSRTKSARSKAKRVKSQALMICPYPTRPDGSATITADSYHHLEVVNQKYRKDLYNTFDGSSESWERLAVCLCHMSKVGHPWKSFVAKLRGHPVFQAISQGVVTKVTETSLFLWLLAVSDQDVKRELIRGYMTHQPVPLATAWPQKRFCDELLWTMKEAPTLVSLKLNGTVEGVSNILNQTFCTDFESAGSRFGAPQHPFAQIQYDSDMKPGSRRHIAVVDVHGTTAAAQNSWPVQLAKSCQFALLHLTPKDLKSREVKSLVKDISASPCERVFIMVWDDVQEDPLKDFDDRKVQMLHMPTPLDAKHATQSDCIGIRRQLYSHPALKEYVCHNGSWQVSKPVLGVEDMLEVMHVAEPVLWKTLRDIASACADVNFCSQDDELRKKHFPMMHQYIELCNVERDLNSSERADDRWQAQDLRQKRYDLQEQQKLVERSNLTEDFLKILLADGAEANLEQLYKFMSEEFMQHGKEDVDVQRAMAFLHKEVIQWYSRSEELKEKDGIVEAYAKLVWQGTAFEILDGEYMHFPHKFLKDLFMCLNQRVGDKQVHVCSTVGPQSSGKSTLSNHRFGTRFGVSVGRCTRGIFGSFQVTEDSVMLILDTEGLQSAERADAEFDRVMMLFIFAVSNWIDITVKGNMTEPLKKLIQVCVHAWKELEINKVPQPTIRWIMNQEAVQERHHHMEAFKKMFDELKEVFVNPDDVRLLGDFLKLEDPLIATVPTMHSEATFVTNAEPETFTRLMKADSFSEICAQLTADMVLDLESTGREKQFGLETWLDMCRDVFETIISFPNLTSLSDIKQINQRKEMIAWIESKMRSTFSTPDQKKKHDEVKSAVWKECREAGVSVRAELVMKLKRAFDEEVGDLKQLLQKELRRKKCHEQVRKNMSQLLDSLIEREWSEWLRGGDQAWQKWLVGRAKSQGHEKLRSEITCLLRSKKELKDEAEANRHFDELWQKILKDMEQTLDRDFFDSQLFDDIHEFFPEKGRKKREEMWGRAKKMKDEDLNHVAFNWRPSNKSLCSLNLKLSSNGESEREPKSQYKYLTVRATSVKPWWPLIPSGISFDSVDWGKIQSKVVEMVSRKLPKDPQPRLGDMQEIHQQVCFVVEEVNAELADFQQKLSLEARSDMICLAMIYTWQAMSEAAWAEHMKPIEEFKEEESKQRKYFCSQVLQNSDADREMARKWISDIMKKCMDERMLLDAARLVDMEIANHERLLCRNAIQEHLDNLVGSDELQKLQVKYILNPKHILRQELQSRFVKLVSPRIKEREEELVAEVKGLLGFLASALRSLRDNPDLQAERRLIEAGDLSTQDPSMTEDLCKKALAMWLVSFLTMDGDLPTEWAVDGHQLVCNGAGHVKTCQLPCRGSPVKDEKLKCWIQAVDPERVGNLHYFVDAAMDELESQMKVLHSDVQNEIRSIVKKRTKELKDKLVPCPVRCPCCGRLCANPDPKHTVHYAHGHYPRGFTGRYVRWSSDEEFASTLMCSEMKDSTSIYEPGYAQSIPWKTFKEHHQDWDFGESDPDRHDFEAKAQLAWKKLGHIFCKHFGTTFTEYGEQSAATPRSRHYLLILDASVSMDGPGKWDAVLEAMQHMAGKESELALESKFSVIPFSSSAEVAVDSVTASEILQSTISPPFWGTNMAAAFQCAADFVSRVDFSDHQPMVVFMTDGHDQRSYNDDDQQVLVDSRKLALCNLMTHLSEAQLEHGWDFRAIGFGPGADSETLKEIAKQLSPAARSSQYIQASDAKKLIQAFVEIAQPSASASGAASADGAE